MFGNFDGILIHFEYRDPSTFTDFVVAIERFQNGDENYRLFPIIISMTTSNWFLLKIAFFANELQNYLYANDFIVTFNNKIYFGLS